MTDTATTRTSPPDEDSRPYRFVDHIASLLREDGAARRALASGLRPWTGEPPGAMNRYLAPWLPTDLHPQRLRAYCTVAALMTTASRTGIGSGVSIGTALGRASRSLSATTTELALRRVARHTTAGPYTHLRGAVRLADAAGIALDWARLLRELDSWYFTGSRTCTQWQQDYYRITENLPTANTPTTDSE
ncbi:type I-E CRISPR-associated protein Cse2/CasB [Kitasatospora acidiphila]|uniref:type I-E CRISPR-associated protein Cse2/CasB n=1 Tax=Kitasatospora acidiphila TaxID=2567942 RepID=UPI003C74E16E